ncbi:MAG TPA: adenylate/guanylate cyclase domain-containing protein [Actinomycetota bacterium]|nr:adenylate/guanylate cyclase domain-containing protein [Actinomycetota bacterium]
MPSLHEARKTVTVLFCDVEGSTRLGDRLDPESVRRLMMRFFAEMRSVLERHGGTVEKYIGDAVMAVFGVPRLREDDALRAVSAAEDMHAALGRLNDEIEARWGLRLRIRIGVNTGEVVVGDAEAGEALVVGDSVNVAARLEQAALPDGTLIGADTYALVRDHVTVEDTGPLDLKGKPEPVHAYRLIGVHRGVDAIGSRPELPLVGRGDELDALTGAYRRCVAERRAVLATVLGPAGVGKSRLSREFVSGLDAGPLVLTGRCLPYGDGITFWPVIELVKQSCAIADDDDRATVAQKIEAAVQGADADALIAARLGSLLGLGETTAELQETFWALRRFLEWLGRDRPVVIVLDDLQWAEPTLLDLLEYLLGSVADTALLLLCLARPEMMEARPAWGSAPGPSTWVSLSPLDEGESERLIDSLLAGGTVENQVTRRIAEAAGGNPLFLEEMLRMLEDDGLLHREDGRWVAARPLKDVRIPASIHALLGARLDRLSAEERSVIRSAAVIGKVFWWGAVSELVPSEMRAQVGGHLQTLVRKDLIRPDRSTFSGEDAFRFHHILVQEAAYRGIPKEVRADLHERFAEWARGVAGDRAVELDEVIGYHLERAFTLRSELGTAGEEVRALGLRAAGPLAAAGQRALDRRDIGAAADLLARAVRLLPADAPERRSVLLALGEALVETGDFARAETALDEAERLAEAEGDRGMVANAAILRLFLLQSTDPRRLTEDAQVAAERLIATLEDLGDDVGVARAWRLVGDLHWARSHYAAADEALARAIRHARRAGDMREEADCLGRYVGSGAYGPAHVREVERRCEELLSSPGGVGGREAPALRALATVRAMEGRFDEARELAERARKILEEFGFRLRASWVSETSGTIEMLAGDPAAAERALRAGFDAAVDFGEQGFQVTVAALLAHALVDQGRVEEAERFTTLSREAAAEDDVASQVLWRSARARILVATGGLEEAEALARQALILVEGTDDVNMHADTLAVLADVLVEQGRPQEASAALDRAVELYVGKGNAAAAEASRRRRQAIVVS